jgi:type I restriction enzyme S subunit
MSDFRSVPLEACLHTLIDYRGKSPPKSREGIPVISAKVVKSGRILRPIEQKIAPDFYPIWMTRGLPMPGDIIMTTEGPLGEIAQLDDETSSYALGQRIVLLRGRPGILDNTFFKYLLQSPRQQQIISSFATGTTVEGISQKSLRNLPLTLPDFSTQLAIAEVLGSLDDKIYLNRQMNETIETVTRAIFRDWFVDFGPVRAKAEGHPPPGLSSELAVMFPDSLDEQDKPIGWRSGRLGDITMSAGQSVNPEELDSDTPYFGLEHMPRRSIALDSWEGAGKVSSGKLAFHRGDFLFGKLRPYFHKVGIAPLDGICSTDIVVLKAKNASASAFVICCISSNEFVAYTDQTSGGTKMPRTSWELMARYELYLPPDELMVAFQEITSPLFDRIVSNVHEGRTLAWLRDLLLPRLLSGETRIEEAEKALAEVA